jgi:hypothetical protein
VSCYVWIASLTGKAHIVFITLHVQTRGLSTICMLSIGCCKHGYCANL